MEFRRETADGRLATPGAWAGPFPSGAPAIFASVAARLGAPTALAAGVGDDAFGRALVERMERDGVRGDAIFVTPARATAVAFVAYRDDGTRDFWFSVHDSAAMELDIRAVERLADSADWLHVSGSTLGFGGRLAQTVEAAAVRVLKRGGRLSLDPNVRADADADLRERMARLARAAHVLFPSEGELAALDLAVEDLAGAVICETRGRAGALVVDGPAAIRCPCTPGRWTRWTAPAPAIRSRPRSSRRQGRRRCLVGGRLRMRDRVALGLRPGRHGGAGRAAARLIASRRRAALRPSAQRAPSLLRGRPPDRRLPRR